MGGRCHKIHVTDVASQVQRSRLYIGMTDASECTVAADELGVAIDALFNSRDERYHTGLTCRAGPMAHTPAPALQPLSLTEPYLPRSAQRSRR